MVKDIIQLGDPILTSPCVDADPAHLETTAIVADLIDTLNANKKGSAGLAAPQIGYNKRICVCRRIDLEEELGAKKVTNEQLWEVLINPTITNQSKSLSVFWEGCLSIGTGKKQLFAPVSRPNKITIAYLTTGGETKEYTAQGFMSHLVQHELDHLDGKLFLRYVTNPANIWTSGNLDMYLKDYGEYPPIN